MVSYSTLELAHQAQQFHAVAQAFAMHVLDHAGGQEALARLIEHHAGALLDEQLQLPHFVLGQHRIDARVVHRRLLGPCPLQDPLSDAYADSLIASARLQLFPWRLLLRLLRGGRLHPELRQRLV